MKKGGYKIIDFKATPFKRGGGMTMMIAGIHDSIEASYGKPLLLSGLVLDDVEYNDAFVYATHAGSVYTIEVYGMEIVINDTDAVTITA